MAERRLRVGQQIAGQAGVTYSVGDLLGEGGTSQVFELHASDGRVLAGKILSPHRFAIDATMRERFARECRELSSISDPNVVAAEDVAHYGDEPVLVMELIEDSLHRVLATNHGPVDFVHACSWLHDLLSGLAALHRRGTVHRDVSPRNLLLRSSGELVVADGGTLRRAEDATITVEESRLGSLVYVSPQQFDDGHAAVPSDDVYSAGQVAFELLTGVRPQGNVGQLSAFRWRRLRRPVDAHRWYDPNIDALIDEMRSFDEYRRPADAGEALARFREMLIAHSLSVPGFSLGRELVAAQRSHLNAQRAGARARTADALDQAAEAVGPLCLDMGALLAAVERPGPNDGNADYVLASPAVRQPPLAVWHLEYTERNSADGGGPSVRNKFCGRVAPLPYGQWGDTRDELSVDVRELTEAVTELSALPPQHFESLLEPFAIEGIERSRRCAACHAPLRLHWWETSGKPVRRIARFAHCVTSSCSSEWCCCVCCGEVAAAVHRDAHGAYQALGCLCGPIVPARVTTVAVSAVNPVDRLDRHDRVRVWHNTL